MEDILRLLKKGERRAAIKLTHVGEQTVPVMTIVIHAHYYFPKMDVFRQFQAGTSYANDTLDEILTFTVSPDECRRIVECASRARKNVESSYALSITVVIMSSDGVKGHQTLLSQKAGV